MFMWLAVFIFDGTSGMRDIQLVNPLQSPGMAQKDGKFIPIEACFSAMAVDQFNQQLGAYAVLVKHSDRQ